MADNEEKPSLANPVPSFANPFRPQLQHRTVDIRPFSFDSRTTEMLQHREQLLNDVIEQEQKVTIATTDNNNNTISDVLFNWEIFLNLCWPAPRRIRFIIIIGPGLLHI